MKLVSIEFSQVLQIGGFTTPSGSIYFPDIIGGLRERYGFMKMPNSIEELDLSKGVDFTHGKFGNTVIDSFKVYNDGLLAQTKSKVENAENFMEDVIAWAEEKFGTQMIESDLAKRTFDSHIVVHMDIDLPGLLQPISGLGVAINNALETYEMEAPSYITGGLMLQADTSQVVGIRPSTFTLERRAGVKFDSNLYFSCSPLKTQDHLDILEKLETLI